MFYRVTPRNVAQKVTVGGSSTQSAAFNAVTKLVRLLSTVDCYVAFGSNPTATSSSLYMVAGVPEYFAVDPGSKVAVLQVASGGNLSIAEGSHVQG